MWAGRRAVRMPRAFARGRLSTILSEIGRQLPEKPIGLIIGNHTGFRGVVIAPSLRVVIAPSLGVAIAPHPGGDCTGITFLSTEASHSSKRVAIAPCFWSLCGG